MDFQGLGRTPRFNEVSQGTSNPHPLDDLSTFPQTSFELTEPTTKLGSQGVRKNSLLEIRLTPRNPGIFLVTCGGAGEKNRAHVYIYKQTSQIFTKIYGFIINKKKTKRHYYLINIITYIIFYYFFYILLLHN